MANLLGQDNDRHTVTVSVIIPAYNCEQYIDECLASIVEQNLDGIPPGIRVHIEISIYEDASTDSTYDVIQDWLRQRAAVDADAEAGSRDKENGGGGHCHYRIPTYRGNAADASTSWPMTAISVKLTRNTSPKPRGVGFARNRSVDQSTGDFICFCDADDIMMPTRLAEQLKCAQANPQALIGTKFVRLPLNSMETLTTWANSLTPAQLHTQIFSSFGPTLVMPTWFCSRQVYDNVGGFDEGGYGVAEDLIFFYEHLSHGGKLVRVESAEPLMIYRHHSAATTFSVSADSIWKLRLDKLESLVLSRWTSFTIWNAGKLGRKLFRSLCAENQAKVASFCDVDAKKIAQKFYHPHPINRNIPIVHFRDARPPFIICVKTELTFGLHAHTQPVTDAIENGSMPTPTNRTPAPPTPPGVTQDSVGAGTLQSTFLENLASLNLVEGVDYFYFN